MLDGAPRRRAPPALVRPPAAFLDLFKPARYKVYYSGRGAGKSWAFAQVLIAKAQTERRLRIGCFREYQTSIDDSVHHLLEEQIEAMGLRAWFDITRKSIVSLATGSEFIFKGLHANVQEIKSLEGLDIGWVEEAQSVSHDSWQVLIPTLRKAGSEIWVSMNPWEDTDSTYKRFITNAAALRASKLGAVIKKVSWKDNPYFPAVLDEERRFMLRTDPEAYEHVWEGATRTLTDAVIFKGRYSAETFMTPKDVRFYHGLDFGFAQDPTALLRCYVTDNGDGTDDLWIDQELYGLKIELDAMPDWLRRVDTADTWPIKADNARPETISFLAGKGFKIKAAEKWAGSVEDGITHLRGFRMIHIHERCVHTAQEARLYSYKIDRVSNDILPVIVDKHNHCWDAARYALDGFIKKRGKAAQWEKLAS